MSFNQWRKARELIYVEKEEQDRFNRSGGSSASGCIRSYLWYAFFLIIVLPIVVNSCGLIG